MNRIFLTEEGQIAFEEDTIIGIHLPHFDVVELEFDEELDDLDYYLAEFDLEEAI